MQIKSAIAETPESPALEVMASARPLPPSLRVFFIHSPAMRHVHAHIAQAAATDATVLIEGESGAGKSLVAYALHARSARGHRPLVKVNCATLPGELLESELFGHERGAFTGAHRRKPGKFELAHEGTIFLDEVGELPPPCRPSSCKCCRTGSSRAWAARRTSG